MTDRTQEEINAEREAQHARGEADDYWWLVVRTPARDIHLYELGYATKVDDHDDAEDPEKVTGTHDEILPDERHAQIMAELGAPADASPETGWELTMAPGRPNAYVEPKEWDAAGELLPVRAKAGVTLHLLPEAEPEAVEV